MRTGVRSLYGSHHDLPAASSAGPSRIRPSGLPGEDRVVLRWRLAGVAATLGLLVGGGAVMRVGASVLPARVSDAASVLHLFYTPPVLVRAGERVRVPVDVVCATEAGEACSATAEIEVDDGLGHLLRSGSEAVKGLEFD